jgi:glyoxylase-like metal-dependent hydrolase (beta-lactamase superfamily II)
LTAPEILEGDTLYLEGEELRIIALGHTDTANSTALYVPSIGLLVSGDAVYNNTHSPKAMKRPGTSGFARSIKSRLCIRKR